MDDLLVIGGGPAGVTAALRGRELGATVTLVEAGRMGGTCTNDGCVPTRVLAKAARLVRDAEQFETYGLSPCRPDVSFPAVLSRAAAVIEELHQKKQLPGHLRVAGVKLLTRTGPAHFVDPHTVALPDGRRLEARHIIIAAGGHARRLPFPGGDLARTHSDLWTLERLPNPVAIIGAAATGCQLASVLAAFGADVTLLEIAPHILGGEDPAIRAAVATGLTGAGVRLITGIGGVDSLVQDPQTPAQMILTYHDAEGTHALSVGEAIITAGWPGNTDALDLEAAGVVQEGSYIVVNDHLQSSVPHIFAAGDITGRMMLVQSGSYEGRVAAENAILGPHRAYGHQVVPHGGFTDPEYGSVGLTEEAAREEGDVAVATVPYADLDRAVIDARPDGLCKLIVDRSSRQILGAHVAGEQAVEVVQLVAAGMAAGMEIEQLAALELAYPTFTAILGLAARQIVRELALTPVSPQWRALRRLRDAEWEGRRE